MKEQATSGGADSVLRNEAGREAAVERRPRPQRTWDVLDLVERYGILVVWALVLLRSGTSEALSANHYRVALGETTGGVRFNSAEAWVDEQNLVRKVKLDFDANVSGTDKAHTVLTIDYADFGTAVTVAPPPASEVAG